MAIGGCNISFLISLTPPFSNRKANTIMRELGVVSGNYLFNVVTLVVHFVAIKVVGFWTLKRKLKMG